MKHHWHLASSIPFASLFPSLFSTSSSLWGSYWQRRTRLNPRPWLRKIYRPRSFSLSAYSSQTHWLMISASSRWLILQIPRLCDGLNPFSKSRALKVSFLDPFLGDGPKAQLIPCCNGLGLEPTSPGRFRIRVPVNCRPGRRVSKHRARKGCSQGPRRHSLKCMVDFNKPLDSCNMVYQPLS